MELVPFGTTKKCPKCGGNTFDRIFYVADNMAGDVPEEHMKVRCAACGAAFPPELPLDATKQKPCREDDCIHWSHDCPSCAGFCDRVEMAELGCKFEPRKPPEPELKPCPFCHGAAKAYRFDSNHDELAGPTQIKCQTCWAEVYAHTRAEAIAAWNRRAQ